MDCQTIPEKVRDFLETHPVLEDTAVLVALSGGPDSVALLYALLRCSEDVPLTLHCGYIDHRIRPEAERRRERELVKALCEALGVSLEVYIHPFGELERGARESGRSLEEMARELRYDALNRMKAGLKADYIATGHTLDDVAETLILRFFQGSHAAGLSGIPATRDDVVRPLLTCTRDEILRYLECQGVSWSEDTTNEDVRYLRNAVRNEIIPVVKKYFPGYRTALESLANKMGQIDDFLRICRESSLPLRADGDGLSVSLKDFLAAPKIIRLYTLYSGMNRLALNEKKRVPYRFLSILLETDPAAMPEGQKVMSGYGVTYEIRENRLFLGPDVVLNRKNSYFIVVNGPEWCSIGESAYISVCTRGNNTIGSSDQFYIDKSLINPPLIVRSRREGDVIRGASGSKLLKKVYGEWHVPESLRWQIPVVEDRSGIIAVLGQPFGYKNISVFPREERGERKEVCVIRLRIGNGVTQ